MLAIKLKLEKVIPKKENFGKAQSLFSVFIIISLSCSILVASKPEVVVHENILLINPNSIAV